MKPTLTISEDRFTREFEFALDKDKNPIKLGDGTYGVVYKLISGENQFAIKLLYDGVKLSSVKEKANITPLGVIFENLKQLSTVSPYFVRHLSTIA